MTEGIRSWARAILFVVSGMTLGLAGLARACAQVASPMDTLDRNDVLDLSPEEAAAEAYHERLLWMIDHPLDLNAATASELLALPGVTITDVRRVLAWRGRVGAFSRPEQLLTHGVEGGRLYRVLAPFVSVSDPHTFATAIRSRLTLRRAGGADPATDQYPDPLEVHRITLREGSGLVIEATMRREPWQRYADAFISGSAMIAHPWAGMDRIIVGDFSPVAAEGLVFGQVQGWSGNGRPDAGWSGPLQVSPFHGSAGTRMVRGLGATMSVRSVGGVIGVGAFAGRTPFLAGLDDEGHVTSIALRATSPPAPTSRRATIHEWSAGGRLSWNPREGIALGVSVIWSALDRAKAGESPRGAPSDQIIIGGDLSWASGPATVSAEVAWTRGGYGVVLRTGLALSSRASTEFDLWSCDPGYSDRKAGTSMRGDDLTNDAGFSAACTCEPLPGMTCTASFLRYRRPWITTIEHMPQQGSHLVLRIAQRLSRTLQVSGGYRSTSTGSWGRIDEDGLLPAWRVAEEGRESVHCAITCGLAAGSTATMRIEKVRTNAAPPETPCTGWAISGEAHLQFTRSLTIDLCLTTHATDTYASRVYLLERDVAGAFSAPALYGTGCRWYVLVRAEVRRGLQLSGRYAEGVRGSGAFGVTTERSLTLQCDVDPSSFLPLE